MKKICSIYRSSKKEGMYLYVYKADELSRVPEALLKQFGHAEHAMVLVLHPEKTLARVDIDVVLRDLEEKGFFLQLPPSKPGDYMTAIHEKNSKMGG